jgi:hypothetical protein
VPELHDLFAASVGSSAALIGLLFVAISLAPEKVFGSTGDPGRRADAVGAFTALANVFFVSLAGLMPHHAATAIFVIALAAVARTLSADVTMLRLYAGRRNWRELGLISIALYLTEAFIALRIGQRAAAADDLVLVVLAFYSYALGVSWKLLDAGGR